MSDKKYLPIGTVVLLNGGIKKVMITGFCVIPNDNRHKLYDYSGCLYPEGILNSDEVCLFNGEQIAEVCFVGYQNEEETTFKEELTKSLKDVQIDEDHNIVTENLSYSDVMNEPVVHENFNFSINDNVFNKP